MGKPRVGIRWERDFRLSIERGAWWVLVHRWRISYEDHSRAKLPGLSPPLPPNPRWVISPTLYFGTVLSSTLSRSSSTIDRPFNTLLRLFSSIRLCFHFLLPLPIGHAVSCVYAHACKQRWRRPSKRINKRGKSVLEIEFNMVIKFVWSWREGIYLGSTMYVRRLVVNV